MPSMLGPMDRPALEQILEQERLITIGRLISSVVHEINNPLQAIRGALALALDDLENPRELREYITISQQEIAQITELLNQVRLVYRSQNDQIESFQLHDVFRNAIVLTREETMRQKVKIQNLLPSSSLIVEGVYNHIYIAVLRTVLAFTDVIGAAGGGELAITAEDTPDRMHISFTTQAPISIPTSDPGSSAPSRLLAQFDLADSAELVAASGGVMEFHSCEDPIVLRLDLPKMTLD
jgi:signal transduction histidine kinase